MATSIRHYIYGAASPNTVYHCAEECQKYRKLAENEKLMHMAEVVLELDVRLLKFFHPAASLALAKIILHRLDQICEIFGGRREIKEVNWNLPQPYDSTLPDRYTQTYSSLVPHKEWSWVNYYVETDCPERLQRAGHCSIHDGLEMFFPDELSD